MTRIESKKVRMTKPVLDVQRYIEDMSNFEHLLPKDRISDFQSSEGQCSFKISGMATIGLKIKESNPGNIILESTDSPFSFTMDVRMNEMEDKGTEAYQIVDLDLNPMMKMMVEKPLTNLFDHIADKLQKELG